MTLSIVMFHVFAAYRLRTLLVFFLEHLISIFVNATVHDNKIITYLLKTFGQELDVCAGNQNVIQKYGCNLNKVFVCSYILKAK